jgi:hypothetical protein
MERMEKQLTAVEWFGEKVLDVITTSEFNELLEQAKEMERQQIIDAHLDGQSLVSCKDEYAEQYYTETFKSE